MALSKEAEQELQNAEAERAFKAAVEINSLVDEGDGEQSYTPTQAALKVAKDLGLEPEMIRMVCRGYNNGVVTHHRLANKSASVLAKLGPVPMADAEQVVAALYPSKEAMLKAAQARQWQGVDEVYSKPPQLSPYKPQPATMIAKTALDQSGAKPATTTAETMLKQADRLRGEIKTDYDEALHQENAFLTAIEKVAEYFRKRPEWSLGETAYVVHRKYGTAGRELIKYLESLTGQSGQEQLPKRAAVEIAAPFHGIKTALEKTASYVQARRDYYETLCFNRLKIACLAHQIRQQYGQQIRQPVTLFGKTAAFKQTTWTDEELTKIANSMAGWLMASNAAKGLSSGWLEPQSKLVAKQLEKLSDPDHEAELRRIRTEAMLQDFLNNDTVMSSHDPGEVIDSFNDLGSMAPRVAGQPGAARPVLRKWLSQGQVEPFEANEVATLEKTLLQAQGRPSAAPAEEEKVGNVIFTS